MGESWIVQEKEKVLTFTVNVAAQLLYYVNKKTSCKTNYITFINARGHIIIGALNSF